MLAQDMQDHSEREDEAVWKGGIQNIQGLTYLLSIHLKLTINKLGLSCAKLSTA